MSNIINIDIRSMPLIQIVHVCKNIKTIRDIYELAPPTFYHIIKDHGREKLIAIIKLKINWLVDFLNIKNNMQEFQIDETAKIIADDFSFLTISDIDICFKNAIRGQYGKIYNAIDGVVIIQWFVEYCKERGEEMEQHIHEKHYERKASGSQIHPTIVSEIKKMLKKKTEKQSKEVVVLKPSELEEKIWDEFDRTSKAQQLKIPQTNIPVVLYNGKHLTKEQFTVKRFDEEIKKQQNKK